MADGTIRVTVIQCPECKAFAPTAESVKHAWTCSFPLVAAAVDAIEREAKGGNSLGLDMVSRPFALKVVADLAGSMRQANAKAIEQVRAVGDRDLTRFVEVREQYARRTIVVMAAGWILSVVVAEAITVAITLAVCGRL